MCVSLSRAMNEPADLYSAKPELVAQMRWQQIIPSTPVHTRIPRLRTYYLVSTSKLDRQAS